MTSAGQTRPIAQRRVIELDRTYIAHLPRQREISSEYGTLRGTFGFYLRVDGMTVTAPRGTSPFRPAREDQETRFEDVAIEEGECQNSGM